MLSLTLIETASHQQLWNMLTRAGEEQVACEPIESLRARCRELAHRAELKEERLGPGLFLPAAGGQVLNVKGSHPSAVKLWQDTHPGSIPCAIVHILDEDGDVHGVFVELESGERAEVAQMKTSI